MADGSEDPTIEAAGRDGNTRAQPLRGQLHVKVTEVRYITGEARPYLALTFQKSHWISNVLEPVVSKRRSSAIPVRRPTQGYPRPSFNILDIKDDDEGQNDSTKDYRLDRWDSEAVFDVTGSVPTINMSIFTQKSNLAESCLLYTVDIDAELKTEEGGGPPEHRGRWYKLHPVEAIPGIPGANIDNSGSSTLGSPQLKVEMTFRPVPAKPCGPSDFEILKLLGKGQHGTVYQVRKKDTKALYAMKVLSKKKLVQDDKAAIAMKKRDMLVRAAIADSPFILGLKFSFQTPSDLYLAIPFMPGLGLGKLVERHGRLEEDQTKFYTAELVLALQFIRSCGVVFAYLTWENIFLDAHGHISISDFYCPMAETWTIGDDELEYMAPELLVGDETPVFHSPGSADLWTLGVLTFEMSCGWSPFYSEMGPRETRRQVASGKLRFPREGLSPERKDFIKGLLRRKREDRLGAQNMEELKSHPFLSATDWAALDKKQVTPPLRLNLCPDLDPCNYYEYVDEDQAVLNLSHTRALALANGAAMSTPLNSLNQALFSNFTFVDEREIDDFVGDRTFGSSAYDDDVEIWN